MTEAEELGENLHDDFIKSDNRHFWIAKEIYSFNTSCCGVWVNSLPVFQCLVCNTKIHTDSKCLEMSEIPSCPSRRDIVGDTGIIIIFLLIQIVNSYS